jgi:hypothetical protein
MTRSLFALLAAAALAAGCGPDDGPATAIGGAARATISTAVTWSIVEAGGGQVSASGLYTAPATLGTYHVVATSVASPAATAQATVTVATAPPPPPPSTVPIAADRITTWQPGILADTQLGQPLGADGLPQRTTVCASVAAGGNIQAAVDACPAGQVVQLAAGTYTVSATVTLTKGVVLRGAGSAGAP